MDELTRQLVLSRLGISFETLVDFCKANGIIRLSFFGSILRDDFRPDSDVDVLVTMAKRERFGFMQFMAVQAELSKLLGRPVDLLEQVGVERSPGRIRKNEILSTARLFYEEPEAA